MHPSAWKPAGIMTLGVLLIVLVVEVWCLPWLLGKGISPLLVRGVAGGTTLVGYTLGAWYLQRNLYRSRQQQGQQYQQLFDQNPNPMWVYELERLRFLQVNEAAQLQYGYSAEEWASMTLYDIRPAQEHERLRQNTGQTLPQSQFADSGVWRHQNKAGQVFAVRIYSQPIAWEGQAARLVVAIRVEEQEQARQEIERLSVRMKEREAFLQTILDRMEDVVWVRRLPDNELTFVSPSAEQQLGLPADQLIGDGAQSLLERVLDVDRKAVVAHVEIALARGSHEVEYRYLHPDGTTRRLLDKATVAYDEAGQPIAIQGTTIDVTSLRRAQQALLTQAQRTLDLLDGIDDPFLVVGKNGRLTHANRAILAQTGYADRNPRNLHLRDVLPEAYDAPLAQAYRLAIGEQHSQRVEYYDQPRARWWRVAMYPVTDALAIYCQDITGERRLQDEIERSRQNLLSLINNTDDLMLLVDRHLRLVLANEAFDQRLGMMFGEGVRIGPGDYIVPSVLPEDMQVQWRRMFDRALQGERYQVTLPGGRLSADVIEVEFSFNPIWHQGEVVGVGCVQRDTSERRQREQQIIDQNAQLREVAFIQSHEVRRHLANLMGLISLFDADRADAPDNRVVIESLDTVSHQLDAVIHRIVSKVYEAEQAAKYRPSSGKQSLTPQ